MEQPEESRFVKSSFVPNYGSKIIVDKNTLEEILDSDCSSHEIEPHS